MAVSLACAFGQVQKTLLIDCDLRRPSLDEIVSKGAFNRRQPGLNDLCLGSTSLSECIHSLGDSNVHVLLAGTINPNPQELFCSTKFTKVLNALAQHYDVIVMDSAPSGGLSDALLLSTHVDQVAYVAKSNSTPVPRIRAAIQALESSNAPLAGIILNQVPVTDSAFTYYYSRGYYDKAIQEQVVES